MEGVLKNWITLAFFTLLASSSVLAQDHSVSCVVNRNPVKTGERVQLNIIFTNCKHYTGRLSTPQIEGLQFTGMSGHSSEYGFSLGAGGASSTSKYTFDYQVLSDKDITIPSFSYQTNEGDLSTESFTLSVVKQDAPRNTASNSNTVKGLGQITSIIEANKTKVHLGEPIFITCKVYSVTDRIRLSDELPEFEGFWKESIDTQVQTEMQVVNGRQYVVYTTRQFLIFPQQTGEFIIDGYKAQAFDRFGMREYQVNTLPLKMNVLPLPEGKKENHIGTFGNLRLTSKMSADSSATNEAFNYEISYYGQGNMKLIQEPEIVWPVEFEVFDPEIKDNIKVGANGESGTRTFKYLIIPRAPGEYELPVVSASYFDYKSDRFITRKTDEAQIKIFRDGDSESASPIYSTKSDVTVINHDIRHISTEHAHWKHGGMDWGARLIWITFFLGPVLALFAFLGKRKRDSEANDLVGTRNKKAKAQLAKALKASAKAEGVGSAYAIIGEAVEEYLCWKLGIGRSSFNRPHAKEVLTQQLGDAQAVAWDKLLQQCEMARYAPGAVSDPEKAASEIMKLANDSDSKMKIISATASVIATILVLSPFLSLAQTNPDSLFSQANEAYLSGDYNRAVELYEEVGQKHKCFELEYNLGNAHYKLDNVGEAILHYERAKMIDPLNDDLRANMLLADLRAIDKIEELPGAGLDKILEVVFAGKLFSVWFILGLGMWTIGFVLIAVRLKWKDSLLAPFARGGAATLIALSLVFISFALITHGRIADTHRIVVMSDRIDVKSNPTENSTDLFQLHEGARACIISEEAGWTEIRLDNGNVGWVLTSDVEGI